MINSKDLIKRSRLRCVIILRQILISTKNVSRLSFAKFSITSRMSSLISSQMNWLTTNSFAMLFFSSNRFVKTLISRRSAIKIREKQRTHWLLSMWRWRIVMTSFINHYSYEKTIEYISSFTQNTRYQNWKIESFSINERNLSSYWRRMNILSLNSICRSIEIYTQSFS